jgi:hypothetical protein
MRVSITDSLISQLRATPDRHVEVWDTKVQGLVLRLRGSGRAVWVVRARTANGKRTTVKVGDYPVLRDLPRPDSYSLDYPCTS